MLVTGASGYLGRCVVRRAAAAGWSVVGTYFANRADTAGQRLDVRDAADVRRVLERVRPAVVVHAAMERDDWAVTADGAAYVAVAATALGVRLVHVSSDAVFSGRAVHYAESALPDPVNSYGAAKAAAETAVRVVASQAAVVRTSLIMGDGHGAHEILTHGLASGAVNGALFTDEVRTPVHVEDLADALLELAATDYRGVLNVAGADAITRYDLGLLVARRDGLDASAIPSARIADRGPIRPTDVRLDIGRARSLLRIRLRGAREFMAPPG
jgi:dTDP-4-dehydrorhamnose reductase